MTSADLFLIRVATEHGLLRGAGREQAERMVAEAAPLAGDPDARTWLLQEAGVEESELARVVARHFGLPLELEPLKGRIDGSLRPLLPAHLARTHRILPLEKRREGLVVAIDNPVDDRRLTLVGEAIGTCLIPVVSSGCAIDLALEHVYATGRSDDSGETTSAVQTSPGGLKSSHLSRGEAMESHSERVEFSGKQVTPTQLVDLVIAEAVRRGASDIHIEPMAHHVRIRYRIDGELRDAGAFVLRAHAAVVSRIKILSALSISERRRPQDGRMRHEEGGVVRDLRVASLPTIWGESVVMRILDPSSLLMAFPELGLSSQLQQLWEEVTAGEDGMILVTGPTGSGKTTTLYSSLQRLNQPGRKIITVEDPVEFEVFGINQVGVRPEVGVSFSRALRSMLRQSPDIIMVGEVRDQETAETATNAALTGHLVFSTLHTNDAIGAVSRLMDLGVKPYLVASSLRAVLAQRLVRRVCRVCRSKARPPGEQAAGSQGLNPRNEGRMDRINGTCSSCGGSGYHGRVGLFELLVPDSTLREAIGAGVRSTALHELARERGFKTLREDGLQKVAIGETTLEEVLGATINDSN
ncbi:MAG: GspE/PulE family protein [Opitutaceae bacterium]